jgi:hypothetical protein
MLLFSEYIQINEIFGGRHKNVLDIDIKNTSEGYKILSKVQNPEGAVATVSTDLGEMPPSVSDSYGIPGKIGYGVAFETKDVKGWDRSVEKTVSVMSGVTEGLRKFLGEKKPAFLAFTTFDRRLAKIYDKLVDMLLRGQSRYVLSKEFSNRGYWVIIDKKFDGLQEKQEYFDPGFMGPGGRPLKFQNPGPPKVPDAPPMSPNQQAITDFLEQYGMSDHFMRRLGATIIYDEDGITAIGYLTGNGAEVYFDTQVMDGYDLWRLFMYLNNTFPPPPRPAAIGTEKGAFMDLDGDGIFESYLPKEAEDYYYEVLTKYGVISTPGKTLNYPKQIINYGSQGMWWLDDKIRQGVLDAANWFEQAWDDLFG